MKLVPGRARRRHIGSVVWIYRPCVRCKFSHVAPLLCSGKKCSARRQGLRNLNIRPCARCYRWP